MNKYGINPHPKQISGEWDYMNEYHKQILITLIRDNKKRIDGLNDQKKEIDKNKKSMTQELNLITDQLEKFKKKKVIFWQILFLK